MKVLYWLLGIVLGIPTLLMVVIYGASELGGEVVTLSRAESSDDMSQVRIWIVDENGLSWIEHGEADSFWITHLADSHNIVLNRAGRDTNYAGAADRDSHDLYHQLRREKYGLADQIIELLGAPGVDECDGVPVRLQLIDEAS